MFWLLNQGQNNFLFIAFSFAVMRMSMGKLEIHWVGWMATYDQRDMTQTTCIQFHPLSFNIARINSTLWNLDLLIKKKLKGLLISCLLILLKVKGQLNSAEEIKCKLLQYILIWRAFAPFDSSILKLSTYPCRASTSKPALIAAHEDQMDTIWRSLIGGNIFHILGTTTGDNLII